MYNTGDLCFRLIPIAIKTIKKKNLDQLRFFLNTLNNHIVLIIFNFSQHLKAFSSATLLSCHREQVSCTLYMLDIRTDADMICSTSLLLLVF